MNYDLKKWLNNKMDKHELSFYKPPYDYIKTGGSNYPEDYKLFYSKNDIDDKMNSMVTIEQIKNIVTNNKEMIKTDKELQNMLKSIETYGKKSIIIPNNTNRAHANYLFKELVKEVEENRMYIEIPTLQKDYIEYNEVPIFDKKMKDSFYKFCMENSK
jgi:deoxyhypusine synthase